MNSYTFKVQAIRTLPSPYKTKENDFETIYYLLVNMMDVPENLPLDVNPREPKMTTNVAKRIAAAVIDTETDFYINNRGIIISAKSAKFNSNTSELTISLGNQNDENDKYTYGILDGGHTYTAIMDNRDRIPSDLTKYVRMEIITNVQNIARLSDARNTSTQVSDMALFNLDNSFDLVRKAISGESYSDKIAYKDNENNPIHVSELIRLMYAFDIEKYPDDNSAPIQSYSGKAQVFKRYKEAYETPFYKALTKQLPKLVELYDTIEREISQKYVDYKKTSGTANPRFGSLTGVEPSDNAKTMFLCNDMSYNVSTGYIYPIFGAFRSIIHFNQETNSVYWDFDPIEIWNEVGINLAQNVFETSKNPQYAGKDKQLWLSSYRIVETQSLRKQLQNK